MDATLLERARAVLQRTTRAKSAEPCAEMRRGITVDDVRRVFGGGRILSKAEASALRPKKLGESQGNAGAAATAPQQLRLIPGGKR
jgi:hypothetical protein